MSGLCYVEKKNYSWLRFCSTKPIPGIRYVGQSHIWDLVVKICETRCFPSKKTPKFPKLNNRVFIAATATFNIRSSCAQSLIR